MCFLKQSYLFKKSNQGKALHPAGDPMQVDQESLLLRCGQQMHPIKQYQESKDSAVNVAG